jgi:dTDP-4-amino-4,6-dideoxygalactose transaminase
LSDHSVPFVDLKAQYASISSEINGAISRVLAGTSFILGEEVSLLETEFAAYCQSKFGIGVDNGTSALELALRAFGVGQGDEVITAANSYIATAFAISATGAAPVLVDIDPNTYTMDPSLIEEAVSGRTKAIIPVHLYGHPADMDPILSVAQRFNLIVIEDACQAHGARYRGRRVGSLGHAAAFSFYPAKNLGAYGDGGMVTTNLQHIDQMIRMLRNQGQNGKNQHLVLGHNHRLDSIQAAILRIKLRHLDRWNEARRQIAETYTNMLASTVITPKIKDSVEPVFHLYVVRTASRDAMQMQLADKGISTGIHYPTPIHLQPAYQNLGCLQGDYPVAEEAAREILSLPMYPELPAEAIGRVSQTIRQIMAA